MLLDKAWRMPGLWEVVSVPLYLHALLNNMPTDDFPKTKGEILRMFVAQHEQIPEKAAILTSQLDGMHTALLEGLAIEAIRTANTMIPETKARSTISTVANKLVADGQLTSPLPLGVAIDVLVSTHVLTRSSLDKGGISFQHQQFQEWFGSFEVERLMRKSAQGDRNARERFRVEVLNQPSWEEAILFACERLSRDNESRPYAAAMAIRQTLPIDPILAAEMTYRGTPAVWSIVNANDAVVNFCERWHTSGKVDRAVRFMITTGRPEFSRFIQPLISETTGQQYLYALCAANPFRSTVLGDDPARTLAKLPEDIRKHGVPEMVFNSGQLDVIELATGLAMDEPNPDAVVRIIQALDHCRAERHIYKILKDASETVWRRLTSVGYPETLTDPELNQRLVALRLEAQRRMIEEETNPLVKIYRLIERNSADDGAHVAALIRSPDFPINGHDRHVHEYPHHVVGKAYDAYPEQVANALLQRIANGLDVPYGTAALLTDVEPIDEGPIVNVALDGKAPKETLRSAYSVLGPTAVGHLMDQLLDLNRKTEHSGNSLGEAEQTQYRRLRYDAIPVSRQASFFAALKYRAITDRPEDIRLMANLFSKHGPRYDGNLPDIPGERRDDLVAMVLRWIDIMLASSNANRHQCADVVQAAECVGGPQFLPGLQTMLDRELSGWPHAQDAINVSNTLWHRKAFAAIGGREVFALMTPYLPSKPFGIDAAYVLRSIWEHENMSDNEGQFASRDAFPTVSAHRKQRQNARHELPTCDFSKAIFAVVEELGIPENDDTTQQHALHLAEIGLRMPHGSKWAIIDRLLALPQPFSYKNDLLRSAAIAGEVLPADMLTTGTKELMDSVRNDHWALDQSHDELMGWIELFAFCDQPVALLEALDFVPDRLLRQRKLDRLLIALSHSPSDDVVDVLLKLEQRDPRLLDDYSLWHTFGQIDDEKSSYTLLDIICTLKMTSNRRGTMTFNISEALAKSADRFSGFRNDMMHRYKHHTSAGWSRDVLEDVLAEAANEQIALTLIHGYTSTGRPYDTTLMKAIQNASINRPHVEEDGSNAFEFFSVPLNTLRKELFQIITTGNDQESSLAEACLTEIDEQRDRYGCVDDEPRHPDIASGKAWPLAAEVLSLAE